MKKFVIFGGVFDPPHIGHLNIYLSIKKQFKFDKFFIVPSKIPPLKTHQAYANANDRKNMVKVMFSKYKDVEICDYELSKEGNKISYSIDTIKYFKNKYPSDELFFAIGLDRYSDFKKWKEYKEILKLVKLILIPRGNNKIKENNNTIIIKSLLIHTSSSSLRIKPDIKFLTLPVAKYIANNGLYIEQQIKPLMSIKRFQHTLNVTNLAIDFAKSIDSRLIKKVYIASMYHDICKELSDKDIRKYTNKKTNKPIHVLHGVAGAAYAKKYFNITDKEILQAIANHVIPPKNPSLLSKIIYCADKLEPNRTKRDISNRVEMINHVKKDINKYFKQLYFLTQAKYD